MNTTKTNKRTLSLAVLIILATVSGCANMTSQQRNTAIGATVGGVAGSVLTRGTALGTIGGAAVGGIIGNQVTH